MQYFLIILACLFLVGCGDTTLPEGLSGSDQIEKIKTDYQKKLDEVNLKRQKAIADGDKIAQLSSEKDIITIQKEEAVAQTAELDRQGKEKDKEISAERISHDRSRLYTFSIIMGVLAVVCAGVAIYFWTNEKVRGWASWAGVACTAMASLAIVLAWLLPYLMLIGGLILLVLIVAGLIAWKRDNKSVHQLSQAVDKIKGQVPDFKTIFNTVIDSDVDKHLDAVRARNAKQKTKATGLKPSDTHA